MRLDAVIPVLVTGIHLSADAGGRGALDPGTCCRDDAETIVK